MVLEFDTKSFLSQGWGKQVKVEYNVKDCLIYNVGVGGQDAKHVYENDKDFAVLPTFPFALTFAENSNQLTFPPEAFVQLLSLPNPEFLNRTLDYRRKLQILQPIPIPNHTQNEAVSLTLRSRPLAVLVRKSGTVVETEIQMTLENGTVLCVMHNASFMMGVTATESGGRPVFDERIVVPTGQIQNLVFTAKPDFVTEQVFHNSLPSIYRLSGDYNPLHIDPVTARQFKFPKHIAHGLCSLGFAVRLILEVANVSDTDVTVVGGKFTKPVLPGVTLKVNVWKVAKGRFVFQVWAKEMSMLVLDFGELEFREQAVANL